MLLYKFQAGGPLFTYEGRPDAKYRKDNSGNWYINLGQQTQEKFIPIEDPDGRRSKILDSQAKIMSTTLRPGEPIYGEGFLTNGTVLKGILYTNANANKTSAPGKNNYEASYLKELKFLENGIKSGFSDGTWKPHKSVEGGSDTIAYGHKLKEGENYSKGISEAQANNLLKQDYDHHKSRAEKHIDGKYGTGAFKKLDPKKQILLTDYEYNVGLSKFPSFVKGVVTNNKDLMLKEYKRYAGANEMTQRNEWALKMINSK